MHMESVTLCTNAQTDSLIEGQKKGYLLAD